MNVEASNGRAIRRTSMVTSFPQYGGGRRVVHCPEDRSGNPRPTVAARPGERRSPAPGSGAGPSAPQAPQPAGRRPAESRALAQRAVVAAPIVLVRELPVSAPAQGAGLTGTWAGPRAHGWNLAMPPRGPT